MSDEVPMRVLDLDAAGLDMSEPAPPEFLLFLFEQSQDGYVTLWSARLGEPDAAPTIQRWIDDAVAVYHARSLLTQMAPVGDKPSGDGVTEIVFPGVAPVARSVPRQPEKREEEPPKRK